MSDVRYRQLVSAALVARNVNAGARKGVRTVTEMLKRDAGATCPIDTGTLRNSARATFAGSNGGQAQGKVSYGAPYAIYPHEKPGQHYQGSGRYKWLQLTGEEQAGKYSQIMAQHMRLEG